jgi:hypothetical protein
MNFVALITQKKTIKKQNKWNSKKILSAKQKLGIA